MQKYKNHRDIYQNYCESIYGYGLDELIEKKNRNQYEEEIYRKYMEFNPYIDSDSIMGWICRYMERSLDEIKIGLKDGKNLDISCLINDRIEIDEYRLKLMIDIYKKFKSIKNDGRDGANKFKELNLIAYEKISSNASELANLSVHISYTKYNGVSSRDFCWKIFGKEILENMVDNGYDRAKAPLKDKFGNIYYLNKRYSLLGIKINKDNL